MKDAKGHGSNPRGVHSAGISALPTTKQMHLAAGDEHSRQAAKYADTINTIIQREAAALKHDTGPLISGIYSSKFPEHIKTSLRMLHGLKNRSTDKAFASYRSARLRLHTSRNRYHSLTAD